MPQWLRLRRSGKSKSDDKRDTQRKDTTSKGQEGDAPESQPAPWKALFFFTAKSHMTCLVLAILSAMAAGGVTPAESYLLGKAFNAFTSSSSPAELLKTESKYALYIMALGIGSWLSQFVFFSTWIAFGELQANSARERLFLGMLKRDIKWYDMRKNGVGALIPRLQAQVRDLQLASAQPLGSLITSIATALSSLGLALYTSWKLTLVIISTIPFVVLSVGYLGSRMQQYVEKQQDKMAEALKYVGNAINAIETVKCFNGQEHELQQYTTRLTEAAIWYYKVVNANAYQFALTSFISTAMFVQGFYYGGVLVNSGINTTGDVVTTFFAAIGAFQSISGVLPQMIVLEKGRTAGATLRVIMAEIQKDPSKSLPESLLKPDTCKGHIEFRNVSFAYPVRPDQMAMKDVTLSIPAGETTFIIGKSGSGKSTFAQLLLKFYPPTLGEVFFDGQSLASLDPIWLRNNITLVEQHSTLFEDTMFANIALGKEDHDHPLKTEVSRAAEFALLQAMINDMPKGFETMVGSKGGSMSGGQRQRMALARAYLRDTPVLLLDESTSALDQISRSLMLDAIREWRRGRTTMIITHDISQILADDYAMIFENGCLVQQGHRKDMENISGSPFQTFLSPGHDAPLDPIAELDYSTNIERPDSGERLEAVKYQDLADDPLDLHLKASENPRFSYLPSLFANQHTNAALKGVYGGTTPIGDLRTPATNWSTPPPLVRRGSSSNADPYMSNFFGLDEMFRQNRREPAENRKSLHRKSQAPDMMEKFIETTGTMAARARITSGFPRRRRLNSDGAINDASDAIELKQPTKSSKEGEHSTEDGTKVYQVRVILGTVWPCLDWPARIVLILGFVAAAIQAATTPAFSNILSKLIGTYSKGDSGKHLALIYSMVILGIAFISALSSYFMHTLFEWAGQKWIDQMRARSLKRLLDQPRDFFTHEVNSVSHVMEALDRHAEEMRNLLGRFASSVFVAIILITVSLVWAMTSQWKLTLIAISMSPYIWFVTKSFGSVSGKWEGLSNDAAEAAGAIFTETFTSIKTVRALTLEKHFSDKYFKATEYALNVGIRRAIYSGFFFGLSDSSGTFVMALMFYVGAKLINDGANAAKVVEVFVQLVITITKVSMLLSMIPQMSMSKDSASRLLRLSRLAQDSHENFGNTQITKVGDIEFHNLDFAYPSRPDQLVLNKVNLKIPTGESTAIVGSSGSGKSTIAALLLNLYTTRDDDSQTADRVDITLSGRDLKHIHTPTLRSMITVVSQTPVLFTASIAENIAYGLPTTSAYNNQSSIRQAAAAAGIDEFIMSLPQGYETLVGEGGTGLSGGQAQRVAIARALVRRPAVMILDEATSALDVENAGLVRDTIQSLVERDGTGMTVIIITHSKDMMRISKNIVMLSHGQIVEEGTYDELMSMGGEFAHLLSGGEWTTESSAIRKASAGVVGLSETINWTRS